MLNDTSTPLQMRDGMLGVMKKFLQGSWLGHPLHPIFVHIPVALWPTALVFDILSRWGPGDNVLMQTAFFAIGFSLLTALLAIPTGFADWVDIKPQNPAWKIGLYHMLINLVAIIVWAINFGTRFHSFHSAISASNAQLALSILGTLLLGVSGYLGGRMVYSYGISIARVSKSKWREAAAAGGANIPDEK